MKRVLVRRATERDAESARDWYETEASLGEQFIVELREAILRLRSVAERFPEVRPGVRRSLMRRFPYAVYFSTRESEIVVVAVLHQRRSPSALDNRLAEGDTS